jgi:NDP-sugar pyrophosphorylase family protein
LEQTLRRLKAAKFSEVVISLSEGGEIIEDYFGDGGSLGLNISYLKQTQNCAGTAQALLQAKELFSGGAFLLLYGDVLSDIDYSELAEFHRQQKSLVCTMALTSTEAVNMWGLAKLQGNRIVEFEEKPKNPKTFSRLINAGIYLMEPEIFKYLSAKTEKLESEVFPRLAEEGSLSGYAYDGLWLDISNSAAYRQALRELRNNN